MEQLPGDLREYEPIQPRGGTNWRGLLRKIWAPIAVVLGLALKFGIVFAKFASIFVAPHADGAEGVLVVDLTIPYTVHGLVDEPVTIRFERGRAVSIEGGRAAELLRELVQEAGAGANVIAELGIGLNTALTPRGHTMLDEKAAGTAHVAIGRNTGAYGGDNEASIHVDCIFSNPRFEADGRPLPLP